MKHLRAMLTALALSTMLVVSGVAAAAAIAADTEIPAAAESNASLVPASVAQGFFWQLTTPQDVLSGTRLTARQGAQRSEGTRSDRQFFEISSTGGNDVPEAALRAYRNAEKVMAKTDPGCQISWTLLAAIGRVESNHGRFGGAQLGTDGVSRPEIRGPQLDGAGPFAAIADSDNGTLDRDMVWDRAVGQMQFLPETWRSVARDGDGDGAMNPDDIDDSALGSAVYLCDAGGSLADTTGMSRAAFRYNHSDYYVQLVLSMRSGYETGVFAEPSPPPPAETKARTVRTPAPTAKPKSKVVKPTPPSVRPTPTTSPSATTKPTPKPAPKPPPKPTPSPTPSGQTLVQVVGTWKACGPDFCLGTTTLDLGAGTRGDRAGGDLDGDGAVEPNGEEFAGLVGTRVVMQVAGTSGALVVYVINGHGYRNADGSFARPVVASQSAVSPSATP